MFVRVQRQKEMDGIQHRGFACHRHWSSLFDNGSFCCWDSNMGQERATSERASAYSVFSATTQQFKHGLRMYLGRRWSGRSKNYF